MWGCRRSCRSRFLARFGRLYGGAAGEGLCVGVGASGVYGEVILGEIVDCGCGGGCGYAEQYHEEVDER